MSDKTDWASEPAKMLEKTLRNRASMEEMEAKVRALRDADLIGVAGRLVGPEDQAALPTERGAAKSLEQVMNLLATGHSLAQTASAMNAALIAWAEAAKVERIKSKELDDFVLHFTYGYQYRVNPGKLDSAGEPKLYSTNDKARETELRVAMADNSDYAAYHADAEQAQEALRAAKLTLDLATNEYKTLRDLVQLHTAVLGALNP